MTRISGAVIAQGMVVVNSHVKRVQHPTGGIVAEIRFRNGASVRAGDLLVRLDDTQVRANLAIVAKRLDELTARLARLGAERDGLDRVVSVNTEPAYDPGLSLAELLVGENRLLQARLASRKGRKAQLSERIAQLREEITGLEAQIGGKIHEIELIDSELAGVRDLHEKGLVSLTRVNSLEREAARLAGERGALVAAVAKSKGQIAETELQSLQIDDDFQTEIVTESRDVQAEIAEFSERKIAAEDQLRRIDIKAPQDGVVHELAVHAAGAVLNAGETILLIVPTADALVVEVKVAPQDIDVMFIGQSTSLRFSALNQRITPEIAGVVSEVAADASRDPVTGAMYFLARIAIDETEMANLGDVKMLPGMPVEAFIRTPERTALSYFAKPISDHIARAFREE